MDQTFLMDIPELVVRLIRSRLSRVASDSLSLRPYVRISKASLLRLVDVHKGMEDAKIGGDVEPWGASKC
jgi:hypothetical protein